MTNMLDRIRYALAPTALKAAALMPVLSPWIRATFFDADFYSLNSEAYKKNSAVFACLSALAFAFIEPPLKFYGKDSAELPDHPSRKLIITPNDIMGEGELMLHVITYLGIGGNAYFHKVRNSQGQVIGLKPYHIGNISPVPGRGESWVDGYEFDDGTGKKLPIPKEDIVHFKWPSVDPSQPWVAMPPLLPALREVATDNEAVRYLKAILQNDAVPRMVMFTPEGYDIDSEEKQNKVKAQWRAKYGGDNRGDIALVPAGTRVERISLNLEELAFDAIHRIPESRITACLRVPAIIAGLNTGLENATYSNFGEAKEQFTRGTLSPLWNLCASEIAADKDLNPKGDTVAFELAKVQALQEDTNSKWERFTAALNAGAITINDWLRGIGMAVVDGGDIRLIDSTKTIINIDKPADAPVKEIMAYHIEHGAVKRDEVRAGLGLPPEGDAIPLLPALPPAPTDVPFASANGKGRKEADGGHAGVWVELTCPLCGNLGLNRFDDHKGLMVCPACRCTIDPAELVPVNGNGAH